MVDGGRFESMYHVHVSILDLVCSSRCSDNTSLFMIVFNGGTSFLGHALGAIA